MSKSLPDTKGGQRWFPRFTPGDRLSVYVGDQPSEAIVKPSSPRRWRSS